VAAIALATAMVGSADGRATEVRCKVVGAELRLTSTGPDATLVRAGDRIVVSDYRGPVACKGGEPTVTSIDRIKIDSFDNFLLDLSRGPLAPGATDEGDGTSEIEIEAKDVIDGVEVRLGAESDRVRLGEIENRASGVNLNAGDESPGTADPDLIGVEGFFSIGQSVAGIIRGGAGNDVITATGGPGFEGPYPAAAFLGGSGGDDRLVLATNRRGYLAAAGGGPGDDAIRGSAGPEILVGGGGRDRIMAGAGRDLVGTDDGSPEDAADCGRGRDALYLDRGDEARGCEHREVDARHDRWLGLSPR
jgi:hypothetical protein